MEILIEEPAVRAEFDRWCRHFGSDDPYVSDGNIGLLDVLRAHFLIADFFYLKGEGMGGIGPKDPNLLHSAVYRQFTGYGGKQKWTSTYDRCATLIYGIIKDHPFHDANKRTALLVLLYSFIRNSLVPTLSQRELEDFVVDIAENRLVSYSRYQRLSGRVDDPEIHFISDYLRRNFRHTDKRQYTITYSELDAILRNFGYCLRNQQRGFIDVCRIEESRGFLGLGRTRTVYTKVSTIAFQGWRRTVSKNTVSEVRKSTKLTPEKGIDSKVFFHGTDPLYSLIAGYSGPLERLAYR